MFNLCNAIIIKVMEHNDSVVWEKGKGEKTMCEKGCIFECVFMYCKLWGYSVYNNFSLK